MISLLLDHGIDRSTKNDAGWTALDYANRLHKAHYLGRLKCISALTIESKHEFWSRWLRNLRSIFFPLFNCHFALVAYIHTKDLANYFQTDSSNVANSILYAAGITHALLLFQYDEKPPFYKHIYVFYGLIFPMHKQALRFMPFLFGIMSLIVIFLVGAMTELTGGVKIFLPREQIKPDKVKKN